MTIIKDTRFDYCYTVATEYLSDYAFLPKNQIPPKEFLQWLLSKSKISTEKRINSSEELKQARFYNASALV